VTKLIYWIVLSTLFAWSSTCLFAQGNGNAATGAVSNADARAEEQLKAAGLAKKTADAATNAATLADTARTKAAEADKAGKDPMTTKAAAQAAASAAAGAAKAAADAADKAVNAASDAESIINAATARATADSALARALKAAKAASDAAEKATEAAQQTGTAADDAAARSKALAAAAATVTAADQTTIAATQSRSVALQVVTPDLPVTDALDQITLAALRARITGGAIFFNGAPRTVLSADAKTATLETAQFSQSAVYLAYESQPRLWSFDFGKCPLAKDAAKGKAKGTAVIKADCSAEKAERFSSRGQFNKVYIDPLVNVRLTTIPVVGGSSQESNQSVQAPTESILQSQKAAQIQFGVVTSYNFGAFGLDGERFHWGIGPMARVMFQSVTDSQRALRVWNITDDLYDAVTVGTRVTLYHKEPNSWTPSAYFDVSGGKFQNFETAAGNTDEAKNCLKSPNTASCVTNPLPISQFDVRREKRLYIESRIFLRFVYLGFDLNNGTGPDDLRFIFGMTVGLDRFLKRQ